MKNFMNHNFNIESIKTACFVKEGKGVPVHKNRASHGLTINITCESEFSFDTGKTVSSVPSEMVYLPQGSSYVVSGKPGTCYAINFLAGDISFEPFKFKPKNHQMFIDCFKRAEQAWQKKDIGYEMKVKAELYNIIFSMQQEYVTTYAGSKNRRIIAPAAEYIHNNYTKEIISVEHLAELCGITASYLRSTFLKVHGVSPIKYINNLKITRAKELIDTGLYSVGEAAYMSGFSDPSHFSREFKKWENMSPTEYLKK